MESQPQNPEFRNNPENFHPCDISYLQQRELGHTSFRSTSSNCTLCKCVKFCFRCEISFQTDLLSEALELIADIGFRVKVKTSV